MAESVWVNCGVNWDQEGHTYREERACQADSRQVCWLGFRVLWKRRKQEGLPERGGLGGDKRVCQVPSADPTGLSFLERFMSACSEPESGSPSRAQELVLTCMDGDSFWERQDRSPAGTGQVSFVGVPRNKANRQLQSSVSPSPQAWLWDRGHHVQY